VLTAREDRRVFMVSASTLSAASVVVVSVSRSGRVATSVLVLVAGRTSPKSPSSSA
jgi:hypothetical protein